VPQACLINFFGYQLGKHYASPCCRLLYSLPGNVNYSGVVVYIILNRTQFKFNQKSNRTRIGNYFAYLPLTQLVLFQHVRGEESGGKSWNWQGGNTTEMKFGTS